MMVIYSRNMRQIPKNDEKKDEKRSNPLSRGDVPGRKLLPVAPGCNNSNDMSSNPTDFRASNTNAIKRKI